MWAISHTSMRQSLHRLCDWDGLPLYEPWRRPVLRPNSTSNQRMSHHQRYTDQGVSGGRPSPLLSPHSPILQTNYYERTYFNYPFYLEKIFECNTVYQHKLSFHVLSARSVDTISMNYLFPPSSIFIYFRIITTTHFNGVPHIFVLIP